jgi:hypothetical protein
MQERGLMMVFHSMIIGIILYFIMIYGLKQNEEIAEDRSICVATIILLYMIVYGHKFFGSINNNLIIN